MRRLSLVLAWAGILSTVLLCGFLDPTRVGPSGSMNPALAGGGGDTGLRMVASMTEVTGYEGTSFVARSSASGLSFDTMVSGSYRYVAGVYGEYAGQTDIAYTKFDVFLGAEGSHDVSKTISVPGLFDGDSLYVRTIVAAADDSTVIIDQKTVGYLIDHGTEVLAMGDPVLHAGSLFNPTGLVPTVSVECDTNNFRLCMSGSRNSTGWRDTMVITHAPYVTVNTQIVPNFNTLNDRRVTMLWWKFEDYLPDDVTIDEAYICLRASSANIPFSAAIDGVYAVLDTISSDVAWTKAAAWSATSSNPHYSNTAFRYINRKTDQEWSPLLQTRYGMQYYGLVSEPCAEFGSGDHTLNNGQDVLIDVKDVLQYWVDFHEIRDIQQAGWAIATVEAAGTVFGWTFLCGTNGDSELYSPSLIVKYSAKKFTGYPWDGKPFVFVMTEDDGHKDALKYQKVMDDRGKKMTIFAVKDEPVDYSEVTYMTDAEYLAFYEAGHEVGLQANDNRTMTSIATGDSLEWFISREWIASVLNLAGDDTMNIATFAYNIGDTTNAGVELVVDYGYTGARLTGELWNASSRPVIWDAASDLFTVCKYGWYYVADHDDVYADSVRVKQRRQFGLSSYRGRPIAGEPIVTLSHGTSTSSYAEMDTIGLGLALDEYIRRGDTAIMTFGQVMSLYRASHESVGGRIWTLP